jgi:hypothetical protein
LVKASIRATSSLTERKAPRRIVWRLRIPNHVSIWFIQDAEVGVKWNVIRGRAASQFCTTGVLWVLTSSSTTWRSSAG